jgi:putative acetyltransferase
MLVHSETPADIAGIRGLHQAAFPTPAESALVDALRAAGQLSLSLVATEPGRVIGHVGFSPIRVAGAPRGLGLGPVAVLAECRRRGVAAQLVREGLEQCRAAGVGLVVVLGAPRYYSRFGFTPAKLLALSDEYAGGDAFQALELIRGTVPAGGGLVQYSPEFSQLGV